MLPTMLLQMEPSQRLGILQGDLILRPLSEYRYYGHPALILSDLGEAALQQIARDSFKFRKRTRALYFKALYNHGARGSATRQFLLSREILMIGDFEQIQIQIPEELGKREDNVNFGGIGSLLEHLYYDQNPRQASSPDLVPLPPPVAEKIFPDMRDLRT
ncbi:hypothetical protein N7513_011778 [Penicillium frequentans]|nr:hypothetical protein N7513_011778 [Penicillium glabrum]